VTHDGTVGQVKVRRPAATVAQRVLSALYALALFWFSSVYETKVSFPAQSLLINIFT